MILKDSLFQAFLSAWRNPFRSMLTILGLVFGVSAFGATLLTSIGAGKGLWKELESLVENVVEINWVFTDIRGKSLSLPPKNLDSEDVARIEALPGITRAFPMVVRTRIRIQSQDRLLGARLECIPEIQGGMNFFRLCRGRDFLPQEHAGYVKSCHIGSELAERLFNGQNPLNRSIYINGYPFTIVGVLRFKPDFLRRNFNHRVVVPMGCAKNILSDFHGTFDSILAEVSDSVSVSAVTEKIEFLLSQTHVLKNYQLFIPEELVEKRKRVFYGGISAVLILSFICLFISGVGIMNVLLFSVKERTREIGIRLACGAGPASIFFLILSESFMLCAFGGLIGAALSYPAAMGLSKVAEVFFGGAAAVNPEWNFLGIAVAFAVSLATGMISGAHPAFIACQMEPAECFQKG